LLKIFGALRLFYAHLPLLKAWNFETFKKSITFAA